MSKKGFIIFNVVTGLLKGAAIAGITLWLLPSILGVNIPIWGLIIIGVAFIFYEVFSFRMGKRAQERKKIIQPQVGSCGKAITPLNHEGYVQVNGELWRALSSMDPINEDDNVVIVEVNRLRLRVALFKE